MGKNKLRTTIAVNYLNAWYSFFGVNHHIYNFVQNLTYLDFENMTYNLGSEPYDKHTDAFLLRVGL